MEPTHDPVGRHRGGCPGWAGRGPGSSGGASRQVSPSPGGGAGVRTGGLARSGKAAGEAGRSRAALPDGVQRPRVSEAAVPRSGPSSVPVSCQSCRKRL